MPDLHLSLAHIDRLRQRLLATLVRPERAARIGAALLLVFVVLNLFYQGHQPYAVGLLKAPWDKVVHFLVFGGLAVLCWVATGAGRVLPLIGFVALIGFMDEFLQQFNPGRSVDLGDWVTDVSGATVALLLLSWLRFRMKAASTEARSPSEN